MLWLRGSATAVPWQRGSSLALAAFGRYRFPMPTQLEKAQRFRALHEGPGAFVIPNPWDAASARILATLGFQAFATSSAAAANVLGRRDNGISREESLAHARAIVDATDRPVSADLEKGFGDTPEIVAETIRRAAEVGLVGGSIEDATGDATRPFYELTLATERIAAAVEAARALPFPFTLTARAENYIRGNANLEDTIRRLQAYEQAGADVLFAPGLPDLASVRTVCAAVKKPVNFIAALPGKTFSVGELAAAGVRRISVGPALYRAAMTAIVEAAREISAQGTFGYTDKNITAAEMNRLLGV